MTPSTFTADDVVFAIARRGSPIHWLAASAGVSRHVLEAVREGDLAAIDADELGKVGRVLGLGERVLEVHAERPTEEQVAAARRVVEAADAADDSDPRAPFMSGASAASRRAAEAAAARVVYPPEASAHLAQEEARVADAKRVREAASRADAPAVDWREMARREGVEPDILTGRAA